MTLVFCMKKKLSYLTFLKVMYVKKGINFRHDIYSVEMNTANIYCRRCKYQLCITYNLFPLTLKVVWCNLKYEQKVPFGSERLDYNSLGSFSLCSKINYLWKSRENKIGAQTILIHPNKLILILTRSFLLIFFLVGIDFHK